MVRLQGPASAAEGHMLYNCKVREDRPQCSFCLLSSLLAVVQDRMCSAGQLRHTVFTTAILYT